MHIINRKVAKSLGVPRYFTGKACKHGHVSERYTCDGTCYECRVLKNRRTVGYRQQYYKANKSSILKRVHHYNTLNSPAIALRKQHYRIAHMDSIRVYQATYYTRLAIYFTYTLQLLGVDTWSTFYGLLKTPCHFCKTWFVPTNGAVKNKIAALNGVRHALGAQHHLYCSDRCKYSCDTYGSKKLRKSERSKVKQARCADHKNKNALLELQLDVAGYNYCEKCGEKTTKLAIHHTIMVSDNHKEGTNPAHQMLLCADKCHKEPEAHCK